MIKNKNKKKSNQKDVDSKQNITAKEVKSAETLKTDDDKLKQDDKDEDEQKVKQNSSPETNKHEATEEKVNIDRVAESIKITLEALRMTIKETLPRISMTQSLGLNPVESDILETSNYKMTIDDKFPVFFKLVPIADNSRFLLVPQAIGTFTSAQDPVEMVELISKSVQSAADKVLKIIKGVKLIQSGHAQVPADGTFGLDTQMVDTVVNEFNNPWRVVSTIVSSLIIPSGIAPKYGTSGSTYNSHGRISTFSCLESCSKARF